MVERLQRPMIVAVLLALSLGTGGLARAGTTFPDPVGDVQGGAGPDLTSVSVSHTASTVTFRFGFAKAPPLGVSVRERWVDMLLVGIDVPPRGLKITARGWTGADYYGGLHGTEKTAMLVKVPPAKPSRGKIVARPKVTVSGRTLSFSVSRSILGDPAWLELTVVAGRETSDQAAGGGADGAPAHGTFHYELGR